MTLHLAFEPMMISSPKQGVGEEAEEFPKACRKSADHFRNMGRNATDSQSFICSALIDEHTSRIWSSQGLALLEEEDGKVVGQLSSLACGPWARSEPDPRLGSMHGRLRRWNGQSARRILRGLQSSCDARLDRFCLLGSGSFENQGARRCSVPFEFVREG